MGHQKIERDSETPETMEIVLGWPEEIRKRFRELVADDGYADTPRPESDERTYIVTEYCPHCENEIEMRWNTDKFGYKAFCPVCGKRLMLCDECRHMDGISGCDYDNVTDTCRFNSAKANDGNDSAVIEKERTNRVVIVVEGGTVSGVFASYAKESVEVIDVDTDDAETAERSKRRLEEVKADCEAGKLIEYS